MLTRANKGRKSWGRSFFGEDASRQGRGGRRKGLEKVPRVKNAVLPESEWRGGDSYLRVWKGSFLPCDAAYTQKVSHRETLTKERL